MCIKYLCVIISLENVLFFGGDFMPATAVHAFFAKDVFDILPITVKENIKEDKIKMFAQSIDACKFYNILSFESGKNIRNFSDYFHDNQSQEFFINVLNYMRDNEITEPESFSFLFGFICHYVLDSTLHPYIIYKTGVLDKKNALSYKYNCLHHVMETFLDNDMISRRFRTNPYKFSVSKFVFNISPFSKELEKIIDYSFYNTFKIKNMSKIYFKSLKQMNFFINFFRKDSYGIKRFIYKFFDTFTSKKTFRLESISYHYELSDKHNFLNNNHLMWRNPSIYDITSTESFVDLYLKAIKRAKIIMCASCDYIHGKDIELDKIFDNSSYISGINCDEKKELKYFEF